MSPTEIDKQKAEFAATSVRGFTQGALIGAMSQSNFPVNINYIEQGLDDQGVYESWFEVETRSGTKMRITVEVVEEE